MITTLESCLYYTTTVRLVPSCFGIFDLEPLSLSFDFVFTSEIFKSLSFSLDRLCRLAILCLDQHAHTLHHLESLLTISLDRLDILKEDLFEHEHVVMNPTSAGMGYRHHRITCKFTLGFAAALAVLVTGASQSRQHDNATYLASAGDIAVQSYFFDIQLTNLSPRNCIPLEVLLRVSMHPAWSASEKAISSNPESFGYQSPILMVPLKYRKILLTSLRCFSVGLA
ncbi:hypothetical protein Tco_1056070 [Tanacetum coccineum]|uniref:Uncharacterized protein n=1 Tax=Tanacetum coccineum TaxID=301880 RepID=A0ABQ5H3T4_9ASTR